MSRLNLAIRPMTRQELDIGVEWAAAEGWNPGLHDADSFYAADPDGFLIGLLGDEPIGMISAVKYGSDFGFIGFYIVRPAYRRQGYGSALWEAAMRVLEGRFTGLDGVVEQQENYRKSGFVLAYNNVRYQGLIPVQAWSHDESIVPLASIASDELQRYDAQLFPAGRETFLGSWISQQGSTALACLHKGSLAGYGVIRPCRTGFRVGPLFANEGRFAERLLRALAARLPEGSIIQLDIPSVNPAAVALVQTYGMARVFETARMYSGPAPSLAIEYMFGVTTFELG
ncbi:GNAT family N-acetyltransferase [Eoetvoesiella caeni]